MDRPALEPIIYLPRDPRWSSYQPHQPLWSYQEEALGRLRGREAFALLMAMRTGKSPVLLADWGRMAWEGTCPNLAVIAPAGVYRTWEHAAREHLDPGLYSITRIVAWNSGGGVRWRREMDSFLQDNSSQPRIFLVNVEALSTTQRARQAVLDFLRQQPSMVAIDESVIIKNPSAKRTKFILKEVAKLAQWRRILSGLPTPRSPLDLFSQFAFLDPRIIGHSNFFTFRARYAIMVSVPIGPRMVNLVKGYRNIEELQTKIAPYSFRVPFRPQVPSTYTIWEVELHPEQRRVYEELKKKAMVHLGGQDHVTVHSVISQILRLHQVLSGHVGLEDGRTSEVPEYKTRELLKVLDNHSGKAVIWCSYDRSIRRASHFLEKEFGAGSVARFWGGNLSTREEEEQLFLTDPKCRFMVATPDAGGRGRTWSVADLVVYYSTTNDLDKRDQSESRVLGTTKDRGVDYVDLVAPGTVEEVILRALRKKMDLAQMITGDDFREWIV